MHPGPRDPEGSGPPAAEGSCASKAVRAASTPAGLHPFFPVNAGVQAQPTRQEPPGWGAREQRQVKGTEPREGAQSCARSAPPTAAECVTLNLQHGRTTAQLAPCPHWLARQASPAVPWPRGRRFSPPLPSSRSPHPNPPTRQPHACPASPNTWLS